jgi:hypothetical protein
VERRFARITKAVGYDALPVGAVVEVAFYERAYVVGFGLDQQTVGIKVDLGGDHFASVPVGSFVYVTADEAKNWRAAQKKSRSRAKRDII